MTVTEDGLKIIPAFLKPVTSLVFETSWWDLNTYLRTAYDCIGTHIPVECDNDTDWAIDGTASIPSYLINALSEAVNSYMNGNLPVWQIYYFIHAAIRDGHIPPAMYLIHISW